MGKDCQLCDVISGLYDVFSGFSGFSNSPLPPFLSINGLVNLSTLTNPHLFLTI